MANKDIKYRNNFFIGGGINCNLIDPKNNSIINEGPFKDRELKYEILKKGDMKTMDIDLKIVPLIYNSNSTDYELIYKGTYSIFFEYTDLKIDLKSNTIEFNLN